MSLIIRNNDNANRPIVDAASPHLPDVYFNRIRLSAGESLTLEVPGFECVVVVQTGRCKILVGDTEFHGIGGRADIWSGKADSVYTGTRQPFTVIATADLEAVVAGGACTEAHAPFRVTSDEVESVVVGSSDTKSRREIFHILGQNANGRAGNLLVSELYAEDGCWAGYPPHKHDTDRGGETNHAELYHYRFNPPSGFGGQFHYHADGTPEAVMTLDGDTYLLPSGYHPTVTSPGHRAYVFTILVGRDQRGLVQYFDPVHEHLTDYIPGLGAMRDKFK
ncbi:5-deoxy-glucuronate isomerase [Chelatococcus asaccharovorans]|uniref:5-deoxyglucuronate isomerase n=1 Tax=Chelatococcus asaccharovorans TaxID=28210 RepID=A0A2V3TVZ7_9HYPH|nr:5-deoxy-glucuronate isomerase [Chelatococcus asaccharovorans]MBS7706140.1 5-deoxy-glucuronate isomerase [Chelatococcus asaccharovorans]PXW52514.1 5-deoxyglucuronate isomerase [Chelatococcus asaccharovorans]